MARPASSSKKSLKRKEVPTSVPPKRYFKEYVARKVAGNMTDLDVYDYALQSKVNVLIEGPTGLGKTSSVLAWAADRGVPFASVPSNVGIDPSQLFGRYIPAVDGTFEWVDGPVTAVVRNGGVLLINEINFMPDRIATVLFGLLDKRRQITLLDHKSEVIDAHDDLLVVADMNPGYEGTRPLNRALRNRFGVQMSWDYDPAIESGLLISTAIQEMASKFRVAARTGQYETPVSTNMLQEFERTTVAVSYEFAAMNFLGHFPDSERAAARLVLESYEDRLKTEIVPPDSDIPETHPIWKRRLEAEDGYRDPQWGIKGTDWVFDEETEKQVSAALTEDEEVFEDDSNGEDEPW